MKIPSEYREHAAASVSTEVRRPVRTAHLTVVLDITLLILVVQRLSPCLSL